MIMIWNQKEVYFGYSLQKFSDVRSILDENKIEYKYRIFSDNKTKKYGSRRVITGTSGESLDYSNIYYVYVHKKDYDKACWALQNP